MCFALIFRPPPCRLFGPHPDRSQGDQTALSRIDQPLRAIDRLNVRGEPIVCTPEDAFSWQCFLQVHDELVFEVPDFAVEATIDVVRKVMVNAPHPFLQLSVPLQVDAKAAQNCDDAH
jgi:DNA polymerase family A